MIGGYIAPVRYLHEQAAAPNPLVESLRHELRRGCLALAVLSVLVTERHGYGLRKELATRGIDIEQGTMYPLLRRLEEQGLLRSEWRQDGRRRKRFYRLTAEGAGIREQLLAEWRRMNASLTSIVLEPRYRAA